MLQSPGLSYTHSFCDSVETHNFTASPTSKGPNAAQGINATFNAFIAAIAEIEDGGGESPSDVVCLPPPSAHPTLLELNPSGFRSPLGVLFPAQLGFVADLNNMANLETTYCSLEWQQALYDQQFAQTNYRPRMLTFDIPLLAFCFFLPHCCLDDIMEGVKHQRSTARSPTLLTGTVARQAVPVCNTSP